MAAIYGIDLTLATSYDYTTDYSGYFITPLYTVGTNLNLRKFQEIEFQLARPLRTGEGIKIEFRVDLTASFTEIETWAYSDVNVGAVISKNFLTNTQTAIPACEQIQLKVSLLGTATTSPELKSIILR